MVLVCFPDDIDHPLMCLLSIHVSSLPIFKLSCQLFIEFKRLLIILDISYLGICVMNIFSQPVFSFSYQSFEGY